MGVGASADERMRIGKSGSRFTGLKARARPCLHPLTTVGLLAGRLPGATFSGRAVGKPPWTPCTVGSLAHWPKTDPWRVPTFCPAFPPLLSWVCVLVNWEAK